MSLVIAYELNALGFLSVDETRLDNISGKKARLIRTPADVLDWLGTTVLLISYVFITLSRLSKRPLRKSFLAEAE